MTNSTQVAWGMLSKACLLIVASTSVAMAQTQPNPPTGLTIDGGTTVPGTPLPGLLFSDNFNYVVNKFDSAETKLAQFSAAGWSGLKDEQTQPGRRANGYMYTRTDAPGCGPAPSGRMLTMEGLPGSLGGQTDFYLQLGNGTAGSIPARVFVQFDLCTSRAGGEMSDVASVQDKLIYPLFGSRDGYPTAVQDAAWLQTISTSAYRGGTMIQRPEPGAFTFVNISYASADGPRALISDQVNAGAGHLMSPNIGDPWIRPNRWYTVRFLYDVSGDQGIHRIWVGSQGQPLGLIADFTGGVTSGFTYRTAPLDRRGAKLLRIPTTWGSDTGGPDRWINIDNLRLATSEDALR
ncbi:MAG: hypothetical protein KF822_05270 [Steroidobacteraceae bacterium]|nr:hypothetical protein [Steroidobacteraceae bacterium]